MVVTAGRESGVSTASSVAAGLRERPIPATAKGFGTVAARDAVTAGSLARGGYVVHDAGFTRPLLTLRDSALRHNIESMAAYCAESGVELAPHGKTTMAPQVAARQLDSGAWGITVATIAQAQVYRHFGVSRLLLANELTDPAGIAWVARELAADPDFEFYCYVDSVAGVRLLEAELGKHEGSRELPVLVELGHANGRTGARGVEAALAVAMAAEGSGALRVEGASGYEGGLGHDPGKSTLDAMIRYFAELRDLVSRMSTEGIGTRFVSAGGSAFFDVVVRELTAGWSIPEPPTVLLRSGAYVTHDSGFYAELSPAERHTAGTLTLRPALELWSGVLSRPEPDLALLDIGRRDVSFDQGMPVPLRTRHRDGAAGSADGLAVTELNDQHCYLRLPPSSALAPGDAVCLGISHPCTTFDKWRVIPVVDDDDTIVDAVHTFF